MRKKIGSRGPLPRPKALRFLEGNPGKRQSDIPDSKIPLVPIQSTPPRWLSGNALSIWDNLSPQLIERGVLTSLDVTSFGRYCDMLDKWLQIKSFIDTNGMYVQTISPDNERLGNDDSKHHQPSIEANGLKISPYFKIFKELNQSLVKIEGQFGLTPATRSRVNASQAAVVPDVEDDFDLI